jgi:hypothetical protein
MFFITKITGGRSAYWVLGLSVLSQDTWSNLVNLADQLEHGVVWKMSLRSRVSKTMSTNYTTWCNGDDNIPRRMFAEPCNEDQSFGARRGRNLERLVQPSVWSRGNS